jgi:hypothetical protein
LAIFGKLPNLKSANVFYALSSYAEVFAVTKFKTILSDGWFAKFNARQSFPLYGIVLNVSQTFTHMWLDINFKADHDTQNIVLVHECKKY